MSSVTAARSALARAHAHNPNPDPALIAGLKRNLTEAKLERAIREAVAAAPPLSAAQKARLAAILSGGAR